MSANTTDSSVPNRIVWFQQEGRRKGSLLIEPHTKIIEDIKKLVLRDSRFDYQAFYLEQGLDEEDPIPDAGSGRDPIMFKLISARPCKYFFFCHTNK